MKSLSLLWPSSPQALIDICWLITGFDQSQWRVRKHLLSSFLWAVNVCICDEVVSQRADCGGVTPRKDRVWSAFLLGMFVQESFPRPVRNVPGLSWSFLFPTSLPFLGLLSPTLFKALFTWIWKQATGPFKIKHINMRPTQFFINRSRCFYKVGFQKHPIL